ncbi:MAG: hypothetical protein ACXAC7_02450 [Candidatus Hodarchaeales archaeon]
MNRRISFRLLILVIGVSCLIITSLVVPVIGQISDSNKIDNYYSKWPDMITSRKTAIAKLPAFADYPDDATNWADYAEKSVIDLLTFDESWFIEPSTGIKGFRPYVDGADGWGGEDWSRESSELIATLDVIWPLFRYLQLNPNSTRQTMVDEFIQDLPEYYSETYKQSTNRPRETSHDSWYFMENSVLKWGHLYLMSNVSGLKDGYFGSLESGLAMADNFNYLFPQFVSVTTKEATRNNNINYGTAGLLAYSLINAYEMTGDTDYLLEADEALTAMREVTKPYELMYEPQEVAAGIAAAAKMIQYSDIIDTSTEYDNLAIDLFYAEEQVLYYDNGNIDWEFGFNPSSSPWLPTDWLDGMHSPYTNPREMGTGGINAPAYKENWEAVIFWTDYLKNIFFKPGFNAIEPLKILNLNRIKNFYFFSPNIPDSYERFYGPNTLQYIPYEDINYHATRGPYDPDPEKAGYNGKEIYGAGETLWAYLMFEALAKAEDNKSLIVNLNTFDEIYPPNPVDRKYIVFNPYEDQKTLSFSLLHLLEPFNLYVNNSLYGQYQPGEDFNVTLPALGSAYLSLAENIIPIFNIIPAYSTSSVNTFDFGDELPIIIFITISVIVLVIMVGYALVSKK